MIGLYGYNMLCNRSTIFPNDDNASIPAQLTNCKSASSSIHAVDSGDTDSQDLVALHYFVRRERGAEGSLCVFH